MTAFSGCGTTAWWSPRFPDSGWWTTAPCTIPRRGRDRRRAPGARRCRRNRRQPTFAAHSSCCSTARTSRASGGCTSSSTPRCRHRPYSARAEMPACSGCRAPDSASRSRSIATTAWSGWTRTRAARPRSRRRRATSPAPAPVRSESPTVSTSAIPKSPRCFISSRRRAAALPKPAWPSRRRLPGEMSRSTTRAPAAPSIPRPPSAWSASWKTPRTGSRATLRRRETTSWYSGSPAARSARRPTGRRFAISSAASRPRWISTPSSGSSACWWRRPRAGCCDRRTTARRVGSSSRWRRPLSGARTPPRDTAFRAT